MLVGSVRFYNNFNRIIKEIDIEKFGTMSREDFFKLIIELDAYKVIKAGYYHGGQKDLSEIVLYSQS